MLLNSFQRKSNVSQRDKDRLMDGRADRYRWGFLVRFPHRRLPTYLPNNTGSNKITTAKSRSLKKKDTPILTGYQLFHNYMRPHMALDGKTPAELCGIEIGGDNKWKTIIENASMEKT